MVSHDIRTPLTVIKTAAENLADGVFGALEEKQLRWIREIINSVNTTNRLISDILDVAKLESGKAELRLTKIDLNQMVGTIVTRLQPLSNERAQILTMTLLPQPVWVAADTVRMEQVLMNIIGNAIKFTPAQGRIEVKLECVDSTLKVNTADTGPGIPPDELELIFDQFHQIKRNVATGEVGVGLGLAIAKEIITQHQGKIWVESQLNQGSNFIFTLPLVSAPN